MKLAVLKHLWNRFRTMSSEKTVYVKVYNVGSEVLVAACDKEVLGKRFSEGKLSIEVHEAFYGGGLVTIGEAIEIISKATIANLVGNNIVNEAIRAGLVHPEAVLKIGNVLHAQIVKMV